jgi:hypothetical protein
VSKFFNEIEVVTGKDAEASWQSPDLGVLHAANAGAAVKGFGVSAAHPLLLYGNIWNSGG